MRIKKSLAQPLELPCALFDDHHFSVDTRPEKPPQLQRLLSFFGLRSDQQRDFKQVKEWQEDMHSFV